MLPAEAYCFKCLIAASLIFKETWWEKFETPHTPCERVGEKKVRQDNVLRTQDLLF